MDHPYKAASDRAFWKRAFGPTWQTSGLGTARPLIRRGDKIASAGSCFAANIVPFLERAGFHYIRREIPLRVFADVADDHFNYSRFSGAYGNIYTARQAVQMFRRALGRFRPTEDRWSIAEDMIIDPFRPGLKYPATSNREFDLLSARHLASVLDVLKTADVFIFTLGLTETWVSSYDGAVFPACPGTVAGVFDPARHLFLNLSVRDVTQDLEDLIDVVREVNARIRFVITVSPVPLVATATDDHVLLATTYSKSVLRVAAAEVVRSRPEVTYFPAFEIVTGPQAPREYFEADRREPSQVAIGAVMGAFLAHCETDVSVDVSGASLPVAGGDSGTKIESAPSTVELAAAMSRLIADAQCEEAAAGL